MTIQDKASMFNDFVQSSFRNAMDAVENIHQITAEIPIEILKEIGYPEDKADIVIDSHRRILRIVYGGICNAHEDLGKLVVRQFGELGKFAEGIAASGYNASSQAEKTKVRKKSTRTKVIDKSAASDTDD
jgi:hypothetical protein